MKFTKMHGIGNDYVYVNCFEEKLPMEPGRLAELVSNRNFGVGSDGLILIGPSDKADFMMDIYNADGSRGKMCGNGIRCVAKYVYDHGLTNMTSIKIETLSGIKDVNLTVKDGSARLISVKMGIPVLLSNGLNLELTPENMNGLSNENIFEEIVADGVIYNMVHISMGNPHAVLFVDDPAAVRMENIGPLLENHQRFPDRTNVEFVRVIDESDINMRVWERGAGETMACGTGACASATACMLAGFTGACVNVKLLGGTLLIERDNDTGNIIMKGPAVEVFNGEMMF